MRFVSLLLAALLSILLHEAAHGVFADTFGDPTPRRWKRATWDPRAHFDLILTGLLPIVSGLATFGHVVLGAARPMPVTWSKLDRGEQLCVILVGPAINAGLGLLALLFHGTWLRDFADLQFALVILNLLPIPPLDGWRLVQWTRRTL